MPTPAGLPKVGEVWERTVSLPPDWLPYRTRFAVIERGRGDRWSLLVYVPGEGRRWVNAAAWLARGQLRHIGPAGQKTRRALGLPNGSGPEVWPTTSRGDT